MAVTITAHGPTALRDFGFADADADVITSYGIGTTAHTAGDLLYASGAHALARLPVGVSAGMFIRSDGSVPGWSTLVLPNSATQGDLIVATGANALGSVAGAATGNALLSGGATSVPSWGKIGLTTHVTGTLPKANGGTGNTNGTADTLTTPRAIYGNNFDGSAALAQIIASTFGGTGNGFAKLSGPTTSEKTFTLPDATCTILTSNAAVTVAQGGTSLATLTAHALYAGNGTSAPTALAVGATGTVLIGNTGADPSFSATPTLTSVFRDSGDLTIGTTTSGSVVLQSVSSLIKIGGTTSSFPAFKRSGTLVQVRLADDSNYGQLEAGTLWSAAQVTASPSTPRQSRIENSASKLTKPSSTAGAPRSAAQAASASVGSSIRAWPLPS